MIFPINLRSCTTVTPVQFQTFWSPQKEAWYPLAFIAHPPAPSPWQPLISSRYGFAFSGHFLSLDTHSARSSCLASFPEHNIFGAATAKRASVLSSSLWNWLLLVLGSLPCPRLPCLPLHTFERTDWGLRGSSWVRPGRGG